MVLQKDPMAGGNRIWYSTANSIVASMLVTYEDELYFEDEVFVQI